MLPGKRLGLGLNLIRSRFGNDSYTTLYLNAAYHLQATDELTIASGIAAGFQQFDINLSQLAVVTLGAPPADEGNLYSSRSEEHTSELQSLMRTSYAIFCLTNTIIDTNT